MLEHIQTIDYPDIAQKLCNKLLVSIDNTTPPLGILICGTGIGMV